MTDLRGTIAGTELLALIRLIAELRRTGALQLDLGGSCARLAFREGSLTAAVYAQQRGLGAIAALAGAMTQADFVFHDSAPFCEDLLQLPADDEVDYQDAVMAPSGVLPLDTVPQRTSAAEHLADQNEQLALTRSTVKSLLAVDGRRTIREIIDQQRGSARLLDFLKLKELGLITLDPGDGGATQPSGNGLDTNSAVTGRPISPVDTADESAGCPKLGFADDANVHFARPTALHRCYVQGMRESVSVQEQRELCLSRAYGTCPRLRAIFGDNIPLPNHSDGLHARRHWRRRRGRREPFPRPATRTPAP